MLYARQIAPEYQESYFFWDDDYFDDVILTGNRDYKERLTDAYKIIEEELDNALDVLEEKDPKEQIRMLNESFPPKMGSYTEEQRKAWVDLLRQYDSVQYPRTTEILMCKALKLVTGKTYCHATLRGCVQSEWQGIYYPLEKDQNGSFVREFETLYFNLGSEWILRETDTAPESAEDIDDYSDYLFSSGYDAEEVKQEMSEKYGIPVDQIVLYQFSGWIRSATYVCC